MNFRNIKGITIEIGGDTTGLDKALKGVDKTTKDLQGELKGVDKLLKMDPKNIELVKQKETLLNKSIDETNKKLKTLKEAQNQMKAKGIDENSAAYREVQREIVATENKLKSLNDEQKKFTSKTREIAQMGESYKKVGDKMKSTGSTMTKYVTAPIVGGLTAATKVTADFDSAMSQVQAISGATGDDFEKLRAKAREMGAATKFSATESAEAMNYMAMAGWKTEDMLGGISGIMNLAAASGEDLATTSDIVTDALTAMGYAADDSGRLADVMAAAAANANTNVSMMGETFKYAAPVAGALGYSMEDVAIATGLMGNAGIKASNAGTALRTLFTNMSKPTDDMANAMEKLGVSLDDGQGNMLSFREVMEQLREGFGNLKVPQEEAVAAIQKLDEQLAAGEITEKQYTNMVNDWADAAYGAEGAMKAEAAAMLAGKTGMSGLLAIVNASQDDFDKLAAAVDGSSDTFVKTTDGAIIPMSQALAEGVDWVEEYAGEAEKQAAVMQDNFGGQLTILKSQLQELGISIGDVLMPYLRKAAEWAQGLVGKFNGMSEGQKKLVMAIGLIVAAIGPLLAIGGTILFGLGQFMTVLPQLVSVVSKIPNIVTVAGTAIKGLSTVFTVVRTALSSLWALMMANPIVLVIAAIAALVAAFVILWKKSESFRNFWKGLWSNIKSVVGTVVEWIKTTFSNLPDKMLEIGKNIVTGLWNGIKGAGEWLKNKISGFVTGVIDSFKSFFGIASPSKEMADQIGKWIPEGLGAGITANLSGLQSAVDTMGGVVMDSPSLSLAGMTDEISNAIGTGLAVQGSGAAMPGVINVAVELGGTKVGEKIVSLYDYTKRAKG